MIKEGNVRITVTLSPENAERLEMLCSDWGLSKSAVISRLIALKFDYLNPGWRVYKRAKKI